jgi:predicted nucleotidyltransferase
MNYGLSEEVLEKIRGVFARFPEVAKAVLYGSRAKGNFKPGSDIDLTLEGDALSADLRAVIASALDDLMLPYTIDLSLRSSISDADLKEHVDRVGTVLYEAEPYRDPKKG